MAVKMVASAEEATPAAAVAVAVAAARTFDFELAWRNNFNRKILSKIIARGPSSYGTPLR